MGITSLDLSGQNVENKTKNQKFCRNFYKSVRKSAKTLKKRAKCVKLWRHGLVISGSKTPEKSVKYGKNQCGKVCGKWG